MKENLILKLFPLLFALCFTSISKAQNIDTIRNSSSLNLYQDYLIEHPETRFLTEFTDSLREMWDSINKINYHKFNHPNHLVIYLNYSNQILFRDEIVKLKDLEEILYFSINNQQNNDFLPEKEDVNSDLFGVTSRSKATVNIITSNANPDFYAEIIKIVKNAFDRARDYSLHLSYGKNYEELIESQKNEVNQLFPYRINFESFIPGQIRLPMPPPSENDGTEPLPETVD